MKLCILTSDPLQVLSSTKYVVEHAEHVSLDASKLLKVSKIIKDRIEQGLLSAEENYKVTGDLTNDIQLIFVEEVVNFCFWAEKEKQRWAIEWPKGQKTTGGWFTLIASLERAVHEKISILDADYLSSLKMHDVKNIFRSINDAEIPLIEKRLENLREAGKVLKEKYNGHFINALEKANYDAIELVHLLYKNFPQFRDTAFYKGKEIYFLKRAQICPYDISQILIQHKKNQLRYVDQLTAFADYKLPQMLRLWGIIHYDKELSEKVNNYVLLPSGSEEEIEIRAATIWGVELLRQVVKKYTTADIDMAIWMISQKLQDKTKPYHRTYTIFY